MGQAPRWGGWGHWLTRLCYGGLRPNLTPSLYLWAGESGLGKSTLVHSLFLTDLYKDRKLLSAEGKCTPSFPGTGSPSPPVQPLKEWPSRPSHPLSPHISLLFGVQEVGPKPQSGLVIRAKTLGWVRKDPGCPR